MSASRHDLVGRHFLEARELSGDARRQYLAEIAASDPDLAKEVESLLIADERDVAALDETDIGVYSRSLGAVAEPDLVGQTLGRYTIKRVIASGGMGTVYEATQQNPRRTVALKVMKRELMSVSAMRRFEVEAQILGQLQHPGIAQVFEANIDESKVRGMPYFVMEFISDAQTITEYAARNTLTTRARLELFARVCDAVHHGHQKGVIHRDLKPGNVLVDASGQPKIIDFGVARATDLDLQITTMQTDVGQLIGTLAYMSPEQVAGDPQAIDTRSDVYGLGVLLYELLAGQMPRNLQNRSLVDAARIIQESDPSRLSMVSTTFRGDVETIVGKALEKDKSRRYQSAAELAADIRRFLGNQPIMARPASTAYQLRKFAKRNKGLVIAGSVALFFLIVGLITTSWYAYRASRERDVAVEAKRKMQLETDKANVINGFLINDLIGAADPSEGMGHDVTIIAALEASADRIDEAFADQPEVEVSVRRTIGDIALKLGRPEQADQEFRKTLDLQQSLPEITDAEIANTKERLGFALRKQGRLDEAIALFEQLVAFRRSRAERDPVGLANALHGLASVVYSRGGAESNERTESMSREALAIYEAQLGLDHPATLDSLGALSNALYSQGKIAESLALHERILAATIRQHGAEHYDVARYEYDLAIIYIKNGDYAKAEALLTQATVTMRQVAGEANPIVAKAIGQHGRLYAKQGDYQRAEPYYVEALRIQRENLDPHHEDLVWTLIYLSRARMALGKYAEAEPLWKETYEIAQVVHGNDSTKVALRAFDWAKCLFAQAKYEDAEPKFREALRQFESLVEPGSIVIDRTRINLASCLTHLEKVEEAARLLQTAYASLRSSSGPDATALDDAINAFVELYERQGQLDKAQEWRAKRLKVTPANQTETSPSPR